MAFSHRHHRKGLRQPAPGQPLEFGALLRRGLWQPRQLNWWIGTVFACGSALFMLGGILSLAPQLAASWALDSAAVNSIFFAGSIPFTAAAYLQLYQAANAPESAAASSAPRADVVYFGWRPGNLGWLASALQFAGTLLFNVNTFDAMLPGLDWLQQDLEIWGPDMAGSILFLASGYLASRNGARHTGPGTRTTCPGGSPSSTCWAAWPLWFRPSWPLCRQPEWPPKR